MSRFTVAWLERAQDQLIEVWLQSADRAAVTSAAAIIDNDLSRDAQTKGEEFIEGFRRLVAPPLEILFSVSVADRIVEVARVRRLPT